MAKKHKKYVPQKRFPQKETTGHRKFVDVVYMDKEIVDGVENIYATCTCDKWRSSRDANTITKVAIEAKKHVLAGKCEFRPHDPEEVHPLDQIPEEEVDV